MSLLQESTRCGRWCLTTQTWPTHRNGMHLPSVYSRGWAFLWTRTPQLYWGSSWSSLLRTRRTILLSSVLCKNRRLVPPGATSRKHMQALWIKSLWATLPRPMTLLASFLSDLSCPALVPTASTLPWPGTTADVASSENPWAESSSTPD